MSYGTRFPLKTGHGLGLSPANDRRIGRQCDKLFARAASGVDANDVPAPSDDKSAEPVVQTASVKALEA